MSERMKGFTCCGDCINYNYKKHKCNLGASIKTDARNPFYADCLIPDIPSDKEIRDKAIEKFAEALTDKIEAKYCRADLTSQYVGMQTCDWIKEIAEQMKEVGE